MVFAYIQYYGGSMHDPRHSAMGSSFLMNYSGLTDAERATFNDNGGMVLIGLPRGKNDAFYETQSPILCCVQHLYLICTRYPSDVADYGYTDRFTQNSVRAYIRRDYTDSDILKVYNKDGSKSIALTAFGYGGNTIFDVSEAVRSFMGDRFFYYDEYSPIFDVDVLGTSFSIYHNSDTNIDDFDDGGDHYAVNGVDTLGNQNYGHEVGDVLLTKQRRLILWDVYEHASDSTMVGAPKVAYYDRASCQVELLIISKQSDFNELVSLFPDAGFTFETVSIKDCNPVQVMWINNNGGIEQAIFLHRHKEKSNVKTKGVGVVYNGIGKYAPYQIQDEMTLVLGVDNINTDEYDRLVTLARSWYIALYDRDYVLYGYWGDPISVPRYIRSYVIDFNGECLRGRSAQPFEISLYLPTNNNILAQQ